MKPLSTRALRSRITIKRPTDIDDGKGGFTLSWATIAEPFAEVLGFSAQRGTEEFIAEALQGLFYYRIRIRHRDDILDTDQIVYRGQDLKITAIYDPDDKNQQLVIIAYSGSPLPTE